MADEQPGRGLGRVIRQDAVEPGADVEILIHALQNEVVARAVRDGNIGAGIMAVMGVARSSPARRGAEGKFAEGVPSFSRIAGGIFESVRRGAKSDERFPSL